MKTSEVFKQARKNLWGGRPHAVLGLDTYPDGKVRFCCHAVYNVFGRHNHESYQYQYILQDLLGKDQTLEDWLIKRGYLPEDYWQRPDEAKFIRKIQVTRKAWLNHLINHYESIGD